MLYEVKPTNTTSTAAYAAVAPILWSFEVRNVKEHIIAKRTTATVVVTRFFCPAGVQRHDVHRHKDEEGADHGHDEPSQDFCPL